MSKSSKCFLRKKNVADTPEERVRQKLLRKMVAELGFPKGLIAVEKGLFFGNRRADIICYTKELKPLLLVECKAEALNDAASTQVLGYNEKIQSPFICLATESQLITFWYEGNKRVTVPFLPRYKDLYEAFCRL